MHKTSAKKTASKPVHKFTGIRETILANVTGNVVFPVISNASGTTNGCVPLNTGGLTSVAISGSTFVVSTVDPAHLKWLQNQSANFGSFRVSRAKIIFVGNVGSTATGTLNIQGFKDVLDSGLALSTAFVGGNNGKVFDLASSSAKELSINLPVDSSWKKVSSNVAVPANLLPFSGVVGGIAIVNSVNDLCFSSFAYQVTGAPASVSLGTFVLDYDVEFSQPESYLLNA